MSPTFSNSARVQETSAAFVTMSSRQMQSSVAMGMLSYNEGYWKTSPAPAPAEIIWNNVQLRGWERGIRQLMSWGLVVALIIFFVPIVAFVQTLVNLEKLQNAKGFGWIGTLLDLPFIGGVHS
jgi:hypothetical protein